MGLLRALFTPRTRTTADPAAVAAGLRAFADDLEAGRPFPRACIEGHSTMPDLTEWQSYTDPQSRAFLDAIYTDLYDD